MKVSKNTTEKVTLVYDVGDDQRDFNVKVKGYLNSLYSVEDIFVVNNSFCVNLTKTSGSVDEVKAVDK